MFFDDNPEWTSTVIVIAICVLINATLPIWLRLAKHRDKATVASETNDPQLSDDESYSSSENPKGVRKSNPEGVCGSSVISDAQYSTVSSAVSSQLAAILEARPRRHIVHRGDHKKRTNERDVRYAAAISSLNYEERSYGVDDVIPEVDDSKSIMSKLSVGDVSVNDGVTQKEGVKDMYAVVDTSYERKSCWTSLLEIAEWDSSLTSLAGFFMIQGMTENIISLVQVAVISHMIGTTEANAFIMVTFMFEITNVLTVGFQEAIGVLVPQADGCGNDLMVGRYLQIGMIFSILFQIPGWLLWSFYTYEAMLWFNFDEVTANIAQNYTYSVLLFWMTEAISECLLTFLDVLDREKYVTVYSVVDACVSGGVLVLMAYLGISNMVAIGLGQTLVGLLMLFINIVIIVRQGWFESYCEGLTETFGLKDKRAVRTSVVTAIPLAVTWILSIGEWQVMLIFARSIGSDEVAAWNILGYVWDLFETLTEAIAEAAEVRVGFRMGAGKPQLAKKMSEKTIYLGALLAVVTAGILFVLAEYFPAWITPDIVYQRLIFLQIPLIGFGGILMVPGMVIESILCAQGRVRLMTAIEVIVSWFVAIPVAAISVYFFRSGLDGIVAGLVLGYSTGATVLLFFFLRSNWEDLSLMVIQQNASKGAHYIDTDWDDLPPEVQAAACALGYTKVLWESNAEPECTEKSWNELTKAEQAAAGVLGYNKKKWDGEKDNGNGFDEHDFDDLPAEVKTAAKVLGYTRSTWDNDGTIPIESKEWNELTAGEQNAASILGYTQEKWDDGSESSSSVEGVAAPMSSIPEEKEISYDDCDFRELPADVKKAAKFLGYTRSIWDKGGKVPVESKDWSELTEDELQAACILGYTKDKWDNESDSSSSASDNQEAPEREDVSYDDYDFRELPNEVKEAAKILGYTRSIWDKGGKIPAESKDWIYLTKTEQKAASTLGYNKDKWDNESDSSSASVPREDIVTYEDCTFRDLPKDVKKAAKVLGYTPSIWDEGGKAPVECKEWTELTKTERKAASTLGYTKDKWGSEPAQPSQLEWLQCDVLCGIQNVIPQSTKYQGRFLSDSSLGRDGDLKCRLDKTLNHFPKSCSSSNPQCALHQWAGSVSQNQILFCPTCKVNLCIDCFELFHTESDLSSKKERLQML